MSHPTGHDPDDARTHVFPPQTDRTQVLSSQAEGTTVMPRADGTQVLSSPVDGTRVLPSAAPPRRASSRPVASRPSPGTTPAPAPPPTARRSAAQPAAQPAPRQPAPQQAAPLPWDAAQAPGTPGQAGQQPGQQPGQHSGQHSGQRRPAPASGTGRRRTEPTAVAALVTGLIGFVVPLLGILAIVLGGIGLDRTRRRRTGGRGMAATGITLGSIQVICTAVVVIVGMMLWNTYGDDIEQTLDQVDELSQTDLSVPDLLLGGLTGDLSFGDLQDLAGTLSDTGELKDLGGQCQSGDPSACEDLLDSLPDGVRDQLPADILDQLPSGG